MYLDFFFDYVSLKSLAVAKAMPAFCLAKIAAKFAMKLFKTPVFRESRNC